MKYKYTGNIPAVLLVENDLKKILPGTEVVLEETPSDHFLAIHPPVRRTPVKTVPKIEKKQEIKNARST